MADEVAELQSVELHDAAALRVRFALAGGSGTTGAGIRPNSTRSSSRITVQRRTRNLLSPSGMAAMSAAVNSTSNTRRPDCQLAMIQGIVATLTPAAHSTLASVLALATSTTPPMGYVSAFAPLVAAIGLRRLASTSL